MPCQRYVWIAGAVLVLGSCARQEQITEQESESADEFVARVNSELSALGNETQIAGFTQATYINPDTEILSAKANDRYLAYVSHAAEESKRYEGQQLSLATARSITLLKLNVAAPAPRDPAKRAELTKLGSRLEAAYGEAKYCPAGKGPEACQNIDQLSETLATSRNYDRLTEAWKGWHDIGAPMRDNYTRFAALANEGARELGFKDLGVMWRARYDMPPEQFDREAEKLWGQVKPLYDQLHCHARAQLAGKYGEQKVPAGKPIPAHLFGNMWAQQWNKIYDDLLKPYPASNLESADRQLKAQKWDAMRMTKSAESAYTSLGFAALPQSFWERSMLTRPRDREVVCHASAWDMSGDPNNDDVRIKMCIQPTEEAVINQQMKVALEKIAFLPFGRLIDLWRWQLFSGEITPANYNQAWWDLRKRYQGIVPPVARTEKDFDPGAKYHIPGNTPYTRYFLSFILQFQFHKALCEASGFAGPLHECSVFGNAEAGRRFAEMLALGASQPWQDTLEKLTGTRDIDASAIIEYFQPMMGWLKEQNTNRQCGWQ